MEGDSTKWLEHFNKNHKYSKLRFKKLDNGFCGYPPFDFDDKFLDVVDFDTFIKVEENRLPMFVGTQFGVYPRLINLPDFYEKNQIVAILGKSLLTGTVTGLSLYEIVKGSDQLIGHSPNLKLIMRLRNF